MEDNGPNKPTVPGWLELLFWGALFAYVAYQISKI